jgi:hypothetical protein
LGCKDRDFVIRINNIKKEFLKSTSFKQRIIISAINLANQQGYILLLHLISLIFFYLGLVANMLKIDITASFIIDFNLFNEKRSVLGTLQTLWESSNYLPFFLIFLFGIIIPLIKSGIVFYILLNKDVSQKWVELVGPMGNGPWLMYSLSAY